MICPTDVSKGCLHYFCQPSWCLHILPLTPFSHARVSTRILQVPPTSNLVKEHTPGLYLYPRSGAAWISLSGSSTNKQRSSPYRTHSLLLLRHRALPQEFHEPLHHQVPPIAVQAPSRKKAKDGGHPQPVVGYDHQVMQVLENHIDLQGEEDHSHQRERHHLEGRGVGRYKQGGVQPLVVSPPFGGGPLVMVARRCGAMHNHSSLLTMRIPLAT